MQFKSKRTYLILVGLCMGCFADATAVPRHNGLGLSLPRARFERDGESKEGDQVESNTDIQADKDKFDNPFFVPFRKVVDETDRDYLQNSFVSIFSSAEIPTNETSDDYDYDSTDRSDIVGGSTIQPSANQTDESPTDSTPAKNISATTVGLGDGRVTTQDTPLVKSADGQDKLQPTSLKDSLPGKDSDSSVVWLGKAAGSRPPVCFRVCSFV